MLHLSIWELCSPTTHSKNKRTWWHLFTGPICALQRIIENAPPERKLCLHLRSSGSHCLLTLHDTRFVREKTFSVVWMCFLFLKNDKEEHPPSYDGPFRDYTPNATPSVNKKYAVYYGITTEFWPCIKSFVFANSETETCLENCTIHFPTTPPCSARVDVLETGDVPVLFSLPQMKNWCMTVELNSNGDKITCLAFDLYSSPAEDSAVGHVVLDLTCLTCQQKSRERSVRPTKHVTFALS